MGLFNKRNANTVQLTERQLLENRYNGARNNILLVVVLTVVNIILLATNSDTYFLFSAYIPLFLANLGMLLCGKFPAEVYADGLEEMAFLPESFFVVMLIIAAAILIFYVIGWIFSKNNRVGWLIFALVFFSIDTLLLLLLNGIVIDSIVDYLIHAWVIISLASGISAHFKLRKLPEESGAVTPCDAPVQDAAEYDVPARSESILVNGEEIQ